MGMRKKKARSSCCNYSAIVCSFVNANKSRTVENKEKVGIIHSNVMQSESKASIFLGLPAPLDIPPGNIKLRKFGIIPEIFPISCGHLS